MGHSGLNCLVSLVLVEEMTKGKMFLGSWELTLSLFVSLTSLVGATVYASVKKLASSYETLAVYIFAFLFF